MGISTDEAFEIASKLCSKATVYSSGNTLSIYYQVINGRGFSQYFQKGEKKEFQKIFSEAEECLIKADDESLLIRFFYLDAGKSNKMRGTDGSNRHKPREISSDSIKKDMEEAILAGREPYMPSKEFREGKISVQEEGLKLLKWLDERTPVHHTVELSKLQKWNKLREYIPWMERVLGETEISPPNPKGFEGAYVAILTGKIRLNKKECRQFARVIEIVDTFIFDGSDLVFSIEDIYS